MLRVPALRRWQKEALAGFEASKASSYLAVATPGAGKTTFALMAARRALLARQAARIIVVVPTAHLKTQWADAAESFGLLLEPEWKSRAALPADVHGVIVTYQQVAASAAAVARVAQGGFGILDEIHHAGESRAWGDAIREALAPAVRRLCISGTPFRSDDAAIPFVQYIGEEARPDFEYGYGDALGDRAVVRPVFFPRTNGQMEWRSKDGREYAASFDDPLRGALASQRLRTALAVEGEWLPAVLSQAHRQLLHLRERDPDAGGLVIATSQAHARGIAAILRGRLGVRPVVATSDDPLASRRIAGFRDSREPWLVAVRMVSEGVDIPRLRVGVYATTTTTDLFFRQAVGRLVRFVKGKGRQSAYMFIPEDARICSFALDIKRPRRHSLRPPEDSDEAIDREEAGEEEQEQEQLDLFAAIASRALGSDGEELRPDDIWDAEADIEAEEAWMPEAGEPPDLAEPVPLPVSAAPAAPKQSARQRRRELRELNQARVETLVRITRLSHAQVNKRLNARIGLKRISEATEQHLQARAEAARRWIQGD
ncbi:MAG: DEAD/DEAH box helicase [Deltaproteobacteria bacterium]|nr:DEAD/DEAH box helicase [Deltaproteobacteria bacterium]